MSAVDTYLAAVPAPQRSELERIRHIVTQVVPDAEEVISYGMPGFKYKNKYLIGYAAFKDHLSLFPSAKPIEVLKPKLGKFKLARGTIQFTLDNFVPEAIIKELVEVRLREIEEN
jgi:uncharacterized protein YdhG (YjbR/CyaY superfamily)